MKDRLDYWQKRIFVLCWGAYTFAYLCRLNLSVAIPLIEEYMAFDKTSLGLIGGSFFWVYAFGQLINGRLGDKLKSRYFVFVGLFISAVVNILFGYSTNLFFMIILWALNGYFQSILWGPLIKTLYQWFPQRQMPKIALNIFSSVIAGFLLTWGVLAQLANYISWNGVFQMPGIILLGYSLVWILFVRSTPGEVGLCLEDTEKSIDNKEDSTHNESGEVETYSFWQLVFNNKLYIIMFSGIALGFIREGISLWGPTLLFETFHLNLKSTMSMALVIPFFNFFGVLIARLLIAKFINKEKKLVTLFFIGATICCTLLFLTKSLSVIVFFALLATCSLCLYGATSIITSVIPLNYHLPSSVAGFLDFSIYLGAGLSGIITGFISDRIGWNQVVLIWVIVGLIGIVCMYGAENKGKWK